MNEHSVWRSELSPSMHSRRKNLLNRASAIVDNIGRGLCVYEEVHCIKIKEKPKKTVNV